MKINPKAKVIVVSADVQIQAKDKVLFEGFKIRKHLNFTYISKLIASGINADNESSNVAESDSFQFERVEFGKYS